VSEDQGKSAGFDVSVLGLGAMGSNVARTLLRRGKRVAVWNRSPGKADSLVAEGAHLCATAEEALASSPVSIFVLFDNIAVREVLEALRANGALAGRTIVNYSTSAKKESQALHELVSDAGGAYIKGLIMSYPRNVGHPESYLIHTGDQESFERHRDLLQQLAGHVLFLSWDEAYALSATLVAYSFGAMTAFYEAVGAGSHLGVPLPKMARLLCDTSRFFVTDALEDATRRFGDQDFGGEQATIDVHAAGIVYLAQFMQAQGATTPIFDAVCELLGEAKSRGYGGQDIAAMTRLFAPAEAFESARAAPAE